MSETGKWQPRPAKSGAEVHAHIDAWKAEEKLVESVARGIFATDWPRDDWDRFGPKDHATERYRAMARTAIDIVKAVREVKG